MEFVPTESFKSSYEETYHGRFSEHVLVWPSVSFGNVGQLAMDLLINTLLKQKDSMFSRIGYMYTKDVLPFVGNSAFYDETQHDLCMNLEVYLLRGANILFVQQRSSVIKGRTKAFAEALARWMIESDMSRLVLLASGDDMFRSDSQISRRNIVHYAASDEENLFNMEYIKQNMLTLHSQGMATEDVWDMVRGAGFAPFVFSEVMKHKLSCLALLLFCAEGDNVPDAVCMAEAMCAYLQLEIPFVSGTKRSLQKPLSWCSLYGRPGDSALYY